jgi:hypothetical protein
MTGDAFLLAHTPDPTLPVAPAVLRLRTALAATSRDLLAIPDGALETPWSWRNDEADVRYGLYRAIESLEEATVEASRILRDSGARRAAGSERIAPATIARWDLQGLLATLNDSILDRHPARGEWTARETLAHIVGGQRAYGYFTAWWAAQLADGPVPDGVPDAVRDSAGLPDEEIEGEGTLAEIRTRLDAILDLSAGRLAGLEDAELAKPSRWAGIPVTVGFRLGRWSSHLLEHTIQLDKGLTALTRRPSEVERVVRRIHATFGRLEALVFPIDAAALTVADGRGRSVDTVLDALAGELVSDGRSARAAAGA